MSARPRPARAEQRQPALSAMGDEGRRLTAGRLQGKRRLRPRTPAGTTPAAPPRHCQPVLCAHGGAQARASSTLLYTRAAPHRPVAQWRPAEMVPGEPAHDIHLEHSALLLRAHLTSTRPSLPTTLGAMPGSSVLPSCPAEQDSCAKGQSAKAAGLSLERWRSTCAFGLFLFLFCLFCARNTCADCLQTQAPH